LLAALTPHRLDALDAVLLDPEVDPTIHAGARGARGVQAFRSHPRACGERFMHDPASERRRIYLPRTPVNRGKEKGQG